MVQCFAKYGWRTVELHDIHGYGTIEWGPVLQALRVSGYSSPFNLEVPGENKCPEPIRMAKLAYALELAERMIDL